ncbi:MAG: apolipoprotein N-acyltransferase [Polyangiaceae bacterium UTPRO1]|jgi:apolipoprotein N-acyltransferase|nr:apolipoprotein N-acyltransferase [Myxococcales bacterium]OQY66670.1 MAG: apolipoprotein N-acyltransferase [Polyangiaceae bacterium UTPRO1]
MSAGVRGRALAAGLGVVASAALYALYSRGTWPWVALGWIGLVPFLRVLERSRSFGAALAAGVAMAVAFELAVFGWFAWAIADYAEATPLVPLLVLALAAPFLQGQFVALAFARSWLRRRRPQSVAAVAAFSAAVYVATEAVVPKLFADTLGYPLYGSLWWRQAADLSGVPGLTFVMVAVNELVWAALRARAAGAGAASGAVAAPMLAAIGVVTALSGYGAWRVGTLDGRARDAGVVFGLVQANLGHYDRMAAQIGRYETVRTILDTYTELSAPLSARPDLAVLVWPETVYPTTFGKPKSEAGAAFDREIVDFAAGTGTPLVFGAYDSDGGAEFNAAFFLAPAAAAPGEPPGAAVVGVYRKATLFPLTEYVPAFLDRAWLRERLPWLGTWSAGAGAQVVSVPVRGRPPLQVAPLICYDVLAPALARAAAASADVILTLSNDSWFAFGAGPELHLQAAAFRSIETRRPQVRATNTGISAVIDAAGRIVARTAVGERATLADRVHPERLPATLVVRCGEWIVPAAWLLILIVGVRARCGRRP